MSQKNGANGIKPSIVNCDYDKKYKDIFWENRCFQSPWAILKFFQGLLYNLCVYLFFLKSPTDSDIVKYLENTTLSLYVISGPDGISKFQIEHCKLKSCVPNVCLKSINIVYRKLSLNTANIQSFHYNGKSIRNKALMMELIFFYHATSAHTKFHLYSNGLTEYIIDNKVKVLLPSIKSSLPLHYSLIKWTISPITDLKTRRERPWIHRFFSRIFSCEITRESIIQETLNTSKFEDKLKHKDTSLYKQMNFVQFGLGLS